MGVAYKDQDALYMTMYIYTVHVWMKIENKLLEKIKLDFRLYKISFLDCIKSNQ